MSEIRITYTNEEEMQKMIDLIKQNYKIISISKRYRNFKSRIPNEYRIYLKVES